MKKLFKTLFDRTFLRYAAVGAFNTVFGTAVMFACYNLLGLSYWTSSAANYILGSILSYFLNRRFTFRSTEGMSRTALRFALNIAVCYLIAYGAAKPFAGWVLSASPAAVQENGAMLVGMGLFVVLNYLGQRFFAFRGKKN